MKQVKIHIRLRIALIARDVSSPNLYILTLVMKEKKNTRAQKRNLGLKNNLKCQQITFTSLICCFNVSESLILFTFVFVLSLRSHSMFTNLKVDQRVRSQKKGKLLRPILILAIWVMEGEVKLRFYNTLCYNLLYIIPMSRQCTEVHFVSFFSG